jgi:ABC-type Na+ efflux pump permease subunit
VTAEPTSATPVPAAPSRPPSFAAAALRVFDLSIGQLLWSRRTIFLGLVVGAPVVLAIVVRLLASGMFGANVRMGSGGPVVAGPSIFGLFIWILYLRFIVPVLGVFYGTSLIADEVEDKTITYLFTRPIARGSVVFGKYLAYLVATVLVVLPSVMLLYFLVVPTGGGTLAGSFTALVKDLGTTFEQEIPALVEAATGADPARPPDGELLRALAYVSQMAPTYSLRGGTREILRGMIARGLGLR